MDEYIEKVLLDYNIGSFIKMEAIYKGNTSNAYYILSEKGEWVLRKLKDASQGASEYAISEILADDKVCPKIIANKINRGYSFYDGDYYNLQQYIKPEHITNDIETFRLLGRSLGILHSKLKDNIDLIEQEDRFSLEKMWKEAKSKWSDVERYIENFSTANNFNSFVKEMITYDNIKTSFIHADLGKWNLIYNSNNIFIIDFGEIRRGDNHLDIAAALTSMINFDFGNEFACECLKAFYEAYIDKIKDFQWELLLKNIELWLFRGVIALLLYSKKEIDFIEGKEKMLDLKLRFENIILNNFYW